MQLFVEFRKFYRMLDIDPSQYKSNKKISSVLTLKICLSLITLSLAFISTGFFCLFQSKTMREFGDSFYATATVPGVVLTFTIFLINMRDIFTLIEHFEDFVRKSRHPSAFSV